MTWGTVLKGCCIRKAMKRCSNEKLLGYTASSPLQCTDVLTSWPFPTDGTIGLRWWSPPTEKHQETFHSKQETISHSVITPTEWENRPLSVEKHSFFSFLKKTFDQNLSMILSIWAPSSNLLWLRFHWYDGPTLAKKYVNSSWLFLQHCSWRTSKLRTFCFSSSRLFEAGWLT